MSTNLYIEDTCPICSDGFSVNMMMHNLPCGHVFCRGCIDNISPKLCPVCRHGYQDQQIECVGPWETDYPEASFSTMPAASRAMQQPLRPQWVPAVARNSVFLNAIEGGFESDARPLYVARAAYRNGVHPGKAHDHEAHISYGGKEIQLVREDFEVLIGPRSSVRWVAISGALSEDKLRGATPMRSGNEADSTPLFSARAILDGGVHLGKVKYGGTAHIPYGGGERFASEYHVLVHA